MNGEFQYVTPTKEEGCGSTFYSSPQVYLKKPNQKRGRLNDAAPRSNNKESSTEVDNKSVETTSTGSYESDQAGEIGEYCELLYKKPKRAFKTKQERMEFVRSYMAKEKTEVYSRK